MTRNWLSIAYALLTLPAAHAAWTIETIATNSFSPTGEPNRAVLAMRTIFVSTPIGTYIDDRIFAAYRQPNGDLMLAKPGSAGWTAEVVETAYPLTSYNSFAKNEFSLAIDSTGTPHLTNFVVNPNAPPSGFVRHLRRNAAGNGTCVNNPGWDCQVLHGGTPTDSFLKIGSSGTAHVLYSAPPLGPAYYRFLQSNGLFSSAENVAMTAKGLALDASGRPNILVRKLTTPPNSLFVRAWNGSAWVDSVPVTAVSGDLRWSSGALRACLVEAESNGTVSIRYGTLNGTTWSTTLASYVPVASPGPSTHNCSLTFKAGKAVIAYFHGVNRDLKVATRETDLNWTIETVASLGETGYYPSIGTTWQGKLRVVFSDTAGNIRIAKEQ
ncbi:MAG: hypothetical protein FJW30_16050 [Acidobacteria bacterium]|nr:hypothetical protein [Acidobacteriota bacterium]